MAKTSNILILVSGVVTAIGITLVFNLKTSTPISKPIRLYQHEIQALKYLLEERKQTQMDISTVLKGYGR